VGSSKFLVKLLGPLALSTDILGGKKYPTVCHVFTHLRFMSQHYGMCLSFTIDLLWDTINIYVASFAAVHSDCKPLMAVCNELRQSLVDRFKDIPTAILIASAPILFFEICNFLMGRKDNRGRMLRMMHLMWSMKKRQGL
jgi:hypothetical protein